MGRMVFVAIVWLALLPREASAQEEEPESDPSEAPLPPGYEFPGAQETSGEPPSEAASPHELSNPSLVPSDYAPYDDEALTEASTDGRAVWDILDYRSSPLTVSARRLGGDRPRREICRTSCRVALSPGTYEFWIGRPGHSPRRADGDPIEVRAGQHRILQVHHDHRVGWRALGWVLLGAGASALGLSSIGGLFGAALIGAPLAIAFSVPGLVLTLLTDSSGVELLTPPRQVVQR